MTSAWETALATPEWTGAPVWIHGDVAAGNLIFRDGRLAGLIDWACMAGGDPACDLVVAWELLDTRRGRHSAQSSPSTMPPGSEGEAGRCRQRWVRSPTTRTPTHSWPTRPATSCVRCPLKSPRSPPTSDVGLRDRSQDRLVSPPSIGSVSVGRANAASRDRSTARARPSSGGSA